MKYWLMAVRSTVRIWLSRSTTPSFAFMLPSPPLDSNTPAGPRRVSGVEPAPILLELPTAWESWMRAGAPTPAAATIGEDVAPRAPTYTIPGFIKRNTLYLAAAQACVGIGNQMMPTLGALTVVHLTGTEAFVGVATAILGGCRLLSSYPTGYVTDKYGRKAGLFLGLVLCLVGSLMMGVAVVQQAVGAFFLGVVVFGLGVGAVQQLRLAAADMYPPSRRAEGLGYVLTGSLIGAFGGPLLIGIAQATAPGLGIAPEALAWLLVPLVLIPTGVLVFFVRPDPKEIAAHLDQYYPGYRPPERAGGRAAPAGERAGVSARVPEAGGLRHELRPVRQHEHD